MNKIINLSLYFALLFSLGLGVNTYAVQFITDQPGDNMTLTDTTKRYEGLVHAGSNIDIKVPVYKDLTLAGNNINIENSFVEYTALIAGNNIVIKNTTIGQGAKIAGSSITLENVTIENDVFLAASSVKFTKVNVKGDALVGSSTFNSSDSVISKDLYFSGEITQALKDQVKGTIKNSEPKQVEKKDDKSSSRFIDMGVKGAQIISGLVLLAGAMLTYKKYNKLYDPKIGFSTGGNGGKHILYGLLGVFVAVPVLLLISLFSAGLLAPLGLSIVGVLTSVGFLVSPFVAYYLANMIWKENIKWWQPLAIFLAFGLASLVPYLGSLIGLIEFVLFILTAGYLFQKMYDIKMMYLRSETSKTPIEVPLSKIM